MARSPSGRRRTQATVEPAFEPPPEPAAAAGGRDEDGFEDPPEIGGEAPGAGVELAFAEAAAVDGDLRGTMQELEALIFARPGPAEAAAFSAEEGALPDPMDLITGVGIGPAHRDFESVGADGPGAPVLNVYVAEAMSMDQAKAIIHDSYGIRFLSSDRRPVNLLHNGPIDAYGHRHRERPSPCGISVGHVDITAGTQGVLARGRSGVRRNRLLLLSNNHVLANVNAGAVGDGILQPGPDDGGTDPDGRIAVLEKWVEIDFAAGAANLVDCATAWCWPDRVRPDFIYSRGGSWEYFRVWGRRGPLPAGSGSAVGAHDAADFGPRGRRECVDPGQYGRRPRGQFP